MARFPLSVSSVSRIPRGHTLPELVVALALVAAGSWSVVTGARRVADRAAVQAAREEVVALIARARRDAILFGGAEVVLSPRPPRGALYSGGERISGTPDLAATFGVRMDPGADGEAVRLRWDAMGLGRMTSRTVRFERRGVRAQLVVSSYGRVRRR